MQEEVNAKTVALSVKGIKITGRLLAKAMQEFLKQARKSKSSPPVKHGNQSIRTLTKQGASLSSIEVTGDNIGSFRKTARKYNVDFALKKDSSQTPPRWIVFFKAKDVDALTAAFNEYSKAALVKKKKPSMLKKLQKYKERSKELAAPVKNRSRGEREK
ncbi:PcfB family protein [Ruminococcaceae bacterium OttesenSCG-928-L11]|nr:PcfB family protein [Ruminococcaceae bacterium OttesenSCG-928-L11]